MERVLSQSSTGCGSRLRIACSQLRFERRAARTSMVAAHTELPLLVQRPRYGPRGEAIVTLLTPAAAYFNGDVVDLTVKCCSGSDVTLVTVGATRVNRGATSFKLSAHVEAGAVLRHLPHELIPFAGAEYVQQIELNLEADAAAVLLDVVTPGRSDTPFAYAQLAFHTTVLLRGSLISRECFTMTPAVSAALRGWTHYGSLLALGPKFNRAAADAADARLARSGICSSASTLPSYGIVLKALGASAQQVREALLCALAAS